MSRSSVRTFNLWLWHTRISLGSSAQHMAVPTCPHIFGLILLKQNKPNKKKPEAEIHGSCTLYKINKSMLRCVVLYRFKLDSFGRHIFTIAIFCCSDLRCTFSFKDLMIINSSWACIFELISLQHNIYKFCLVLQNKSLLLSCLFLNSGVVWPTAFEFPGSAHICHKCTISEFKAST